MEGLNFILIGAAVALVVGLTVGRRWWRDFSQLRRLGALKGFAGQAGLEYVHGSLSDVRDRGPQVYGMYQQRGLNLTTQRDARGRPGLAQLKVMVGLRERRASGVFLLVQAPSGDGTGHDAPFRDIKTAGDTTMMAHAGYDDYWLQTNRPAVLTPVLDGPPVQALTALDGFVGLMVEQQSVYAQVRRVPMSARQVGAIVDAVVRVAESVEGVVADP